MFYCMLAGVTAEEKKTLNLGDAKEYKFLSKVLQQLPEAHFVTLTQTYDTLPPYRK